MKASQNYLLHLLSNNDVTFFIPPYQRNYEWEIEQCEVFFEDILKTTNENNNDKVAEHFFGTLVYVQSTAVFGQPNKLVLTDGQQRITTTMLFLAAYRDVVNKDNVKNFINSKYLKNDNVSDDTEYKIKLKQIETDWKTYCDVILNNDIDKSSKETAVFRNYSYFVRKLSEIKKEQPTTFDVLIEKGLNKFSTVTIQLEPEKNSWENPQEVFESMNSLGKPLALADLVRNYLLLGKNANEQDTLYKNYWLEIEKQLPEQVSNFIRDYMQLKDCKAYKKATSNNYKELYGKFKYLFKDNTTEDLFCELKKFSKYYSWIVTGAASTSLIIDKKLNDLRIINTTVIYSFLLKLINLWQNAKLSENDLAKILDALIIYFLRRKILQLTQGENKVFPELVKKMSIDFLAAPDKNVAMFEILAGQEYSVRLPNDIEVKNGLDCMNFYSFQHGKFVLSLIEEKLTKFRPDRHDKLLQMEHIMPQSLTDAWKQELGEDFRNIHQEFLDNIGNLTLIRHNQELGNKSFDEKKKVYENNAGLQIAKTEIINRTSWNKKSIQNRKTWIVNYILENILPLPENMQKSNNYTESDRRRLSFIDLQLIGETINLVADKSITATVISDKEVEFEGKKWRLSPLTAYIEERRGTLTPSGAYQGAQYWEFDGIRLRDIM